MNRSAAILVTLLVGCGSASSPEVIGPQPQPVPGALLSVRADHLTLVAEGAQLVLRGRAAAIAPMGGAATGTVRVFDVSTPGVIVTAAIAADGSFEARVPAAESDLLRVEAEVGPQISFPVDLRRRAGALQVLASPRPCLELDAVEGLRFDDASRDAVVVALHARCALSPKFHLHVGRDFRFAVEPPTTLTSEGSVSLVHSGASPADDLVVVDLGDDAPAILSLRAR